jgi:hypothetical protein
MMTAVRLTLLCLLLPLPCAAARARPQHSGRPAPDARCKAAADEFASAVSDRAHRTVEEQSNAEYGEAKKYLRVCWEASDDFTRSLKKFVSRREDVARCDEAWARLSPHVGTDGPGTPERFAQTYGAAKEFLRVCDGADTKQERFVKTWVEKYDAAVRQYEAEKTLAPLVEEALGGGAQPSVYSRMAEAFVAARYEPRKRQLLALIESGKSPDSEDVREAWAGVAAALDSIVDAYARAVASCGARDGCQVAKGSWTGSLAKYYALRHDGAAAGLEQTIAHALDVPFSKP